MSLSHSALPTRMRVCTLIVSPAGLVSSKVRSTSWARVALSGTRSIRKRVTFSASVDSMKSSPPMPSPLDSSQGTGVRSILVRVGPTGSEFGNHMPTERLPEILESWKYWGVLRHLHWMPAESAARAVVRAVSVPVEESYPTLVEVQPGGRKKEEDS